MSKPIIGQVQLAKENYSILEVQISNLMEATREKLPLKVIEISNKDMSCRKLLLYFLKVPNIPGNFLQPF